MHRDEGAQLLVNNLKFQLYKEEVALENTQASPMHRMEKNLQKLRKTLSSFCLTI